MRIVLSFLLCFVFLETQVFALQGGPEGTSSIDLIGTYAGVLLPGTGTTGAGANTLGIFTLSIPNTGTGSGTAFVFSEGRTFTGPVTAVGSPDSLQIVGIFNTIYQPPAGATLNTANSFLIVTTGTGTAASAPTNGEAQGQFKAQVSPETNIASTALALLDGTAVLSVDFGLVNGDGTPVVVQTLNMIMSGFKQSETASTTTTTTGG